ncbi:MAG: hypothetical protein ACR2F8_10840 [Caulobacteraceae bacterium]
MSVRRRGRAEIEHLYANQIVSLLIAAAKTLAERPELAKRAQPTLTADNAGSGGRPG